MKTSRDKPRAIEVLAFLLLQAILIGAIAWRVIFFIRASGQN